MRDVLGGFSTHTFSGPLWYRIAKEGALQNDIQVFLMHTTPETIRKKNERDFSTND